MKERLPKMDEHEYAGGDPSRHGVLTTNEVNPSTMYAGELDMAIEAPVDLRLASNLYSTLQTIPELRVLQTRGSLRKGAVMTIVLGKPMRIGEIIASKLPGVQIILKPLSGGSPGKEDSNSLTGVGEDAATRTTLVLKRA